MKAMSVLRSDYDICVIGGGINGAGIARDAAGRGLSVLLVEAGDLAGATSSASTKLIHGGLRYLEHYEFGLVRHALAEREVLLGLAPHLIKPMEFILPHDEHLRPAWMIRTGLFLYDHLAHRSTLPASRGLRLTEGPLDKKYTKGFSYADCWVDDARLVVLSALDAAERGATILTRTKCTGLEADREAGRWTVRMDNSPPATASAVINAAGPWVRTLLDDFGLAVRNTPRVRLVKGSHIVVPRLYDGEQAYILQQPDKRIVFAIPYEHEFTLIGTTDVNYTDDPATPVIDAAETAYLCEAVNRSFIRKISPDDVVWSYSGVRPLLDDGDENASAVTRDYKLVMDKSHGPALLSVFGGKITTYRRLAEEATDQLTSAPHWTAHAPLPGGDMKDFGTFLREQFKRYSTHDPALVERCAHAYGTRMDRFFSEDMGRDFGGGLFEAEIRYLAAQEWAKTADDILWRRSKLGVHASPETKESLHAALPSILKEIKTP